jgi:drug/metabolite transporter (DMT)-like permease
MSTTQKSATGDAPRGLNPTGLANLIVVYIVWGTTYLAIRVAVRDGSGFPPLLMAGSRMLVAGPLLLALGALLRQRLRLSKRELLVTAGSGLLIWVAGHGSIVAGEQRIDSGFAALIVASAPLWVALIETVLDRRLPSWRLILSLLIGLMGIALLSVPMLQHGTRADGLGILAALFGTLSWAAGSVFQARNPLSLNAWVNAGYQHLFGALGFLLLLGLRGTALPAPTPGAWVAWGYLVLFGSLLAYTAYVQALRLLPINVVTTYAYVNPVIALLAGAVLLQEPITWWTVGGGALVLLSVAEVFRQQRARVGVAR